MYRSCIFCAVDLGGNQALERFPVGRALAFDGERGRLWAVCPACARWNLAPIEERWEAIEDAERIFRATRLRVQSERIGVCRLRDGTRLIRVGQALPGELAAWRYGRVLRRRRAGYMVGSGLTVALPMAGAASATMGFAAGAVVVGAAAFVLGMMGRGKPQLVSRSLLPYTGVNVDVVDLQKARFAFTFDGDVSVALPGRDPDEARLVDGGWRAGALVPSAATRWPCCAAGWCS